MTSVNGTNVVVTFSYANPAEVWTMGTVLLAVCIAVVALRFVTRYFQKVRVGIDDWLILAGVIIFLGIGVCFIVGAATYAFGYPTPPLPANLTTENEILNYIEPLPELVGKLEFAIQLLTVTCYGLVKLSILAFYRRLFVTNKRTRDLYCLTIGYTSLVGLAGSDLILDVFLIILPLPMIWNLRMANAKKVGVTGIMLLGAASLAASIARLVLYVQTQAAAEAMVPVDFDEEITLDMYWSTLECGLAIIAACLPTLSYLFHGFSVQKAFHSVRSVFSLHSSPHSSQTSDTNIPFTNRYLDLEANGSRSSQSQFAKPKQSIETDKISTQEFEMRKSNQMVSKPEG
ncbi:hypothetical protein MMC15_000280 [Xylographa vitiligo]|nr:hypothetical protein [Xylographa vitiligo]